MLSDHFDSRYIDDIKRFYDQKDNIQPIELIEQVCEALGVGDIDIHFSFWVCTSNPDIALLFAAKTNGLIFAKEININEPWFKNAARIAGNRVADTIRDNLEKLHFIETKYTQYIKVIG